MTGYDGKAARTAELRDAYDSVAERWHLSHRDDYWWVEGAGRFVAALPTLTRARVLDAGCGGGTKAKWLSDLGVRVVGLDISERLIDIARGEAPKADFRVADMSDLPPDLGSFHGVFAQASLLHVPHGEVLDLLSHWRSRMRRGGVLHIAVKRRPEGGAWAERKTEILDGIEFTRFFSYWTLEELRYKAMLAGFVTMWDTADVSGRTTWIQIVAKAH